MPPDPTLNEMVKTVRSRCGAESFEVAVILGSGLGALLEEAAAAVRIPYREIPGLPPVTVAGHAGCLAAGELQGRRVLLFGGRFHLYEGHSVDQVVLPVRLAQALGCRRLLLSNAAGGINPEYRTGDFMCIADHLNLLGVNPLRGLQNPFLDLTHLYHLDLYAPLQERARAQGIRLHQGVLAALPGPSYETPAEIRMLKGFGADAVSMSTVPEAIMGKYLGMEVAGLSLIANAAAGTSLSPLDHAEVLVAARNGAESFGDLVRSLLPAWPA